MFTDTSLSDSDRKAIHDFALDARDLLVAETRDLLEGAYGLRADGSLSPLSRLPNLANDPEGQETHRRLGHFLDDEVKAGLDRREAVDKLVKETAFTHLNRLAAFKMMEARKLIRQTVSRGKESNGFKFYLADHPDEEALWKSGDAGAEAAYRHFLLWQCGQVARELKVLFDPATLPTRLFPRPNAMRELLALLNAESHAPVWASAETIGWVYQYFNEREKAEVFERLYKKKQKIRREDIPAATQLFTPRWIVRFLVENTLGRTWLELHPDSRLKDELRYLVPLADQPVGAIHESRLRLAREITLLDPACGTMHFGLVAFDLFAVMYREELDRAGEPGWPGQPSVSGEADIPAAVLANNLFGIDIDLRAVQLAALTLFLKAKELNKDAALTASNLACADVLALNGERLNAFLREMNFTRPAYERLIRALWARLKDINQLGSLLRLEAEIEALVAEERARFDKEGRQPDLFGAGTAFEDEAAQSEYWGIVEGQLIQAFDEFARRAAQHGNDETFFAGEAAKGLRVLDLMLRRYDCVTANPPYMGKRNMNSTLAEFLDDAYPAAKGDLYTAFIARCAEFTNDGGRLGMITQQSFMFLSSYEDLRGDLLARFAIETMAHTGPGAFAEISGEKVNTTVFALCAQPDSTLRENTTGTYFRLVKAEDKQDAFESALTDGSNTYRIQQSKFKAIPRIPWVYWIKDSLRELFERLPQLSEVAKPRQGLATANNSRFLRLWWEIGIERTAFNCLSREQAQIQKHRWFPCMKGGPYRKWYGNQTHIINWQDDGIGIRAIETAVIRNPNFYFHEGLTFSDISGVSLAVRYMPFGFVFDHAGNCVFVDGTRENSNCLLGILNSKLITYLLTINETLHTYIEDLERIPLVNLTDSTGVVSPVIESIRLQKSDAVQDETTYDFISPLRWATGLQDLARVQSRLAALESQIDDEVYRLYGIGAEDRAAIEAELHSGQSSEDSGQEDGEMPKEGEEETETATSMTREELAVRWVSYAVGVVLGRFKPGIAGELGSAIYRREDFAIGSLPAPDEAEFNELVGWPERFAYIDANGGRHLFTAEVEAKLRALADNDGITVLDEGRPDDLPAKVEAALGLMLGERGAAEVVEAISGETVGANQSVRPLLRRFLERDFFSKWHVKWYRKRPIYWLLQSPKKLYGVYLFHERLTKDTLFVVQRKYLDAKIALTRQTLTEKRAEATKAGSARERRAFNKEADEAEKLLTDLEEFAKRLKAITDHGYDPDINDGVILNLAPLWRAIPAWSKEPQKYWEGLERGDYDWAHLAMKHWPERVKAKCKTDKSMAIAHGAG